MKADRQSGHKNVTWHARRRCWYGRFTRDGAVVHVGYWPDEELDEAVKATKRKIKQYDARKQAA